MKTNIRHFTVLFLILTIVSATPAYAEKDNAATKLACGLMNIAGSPIEIWTGITTVTEKYDPLTGAIAGTLIGAVSAVERVGVGLFETVTFPFPVPADYKPVMDPATPFDETLFKH